MFGALVFLACAPPNPCGASLDPKDPNFPYTGAIPTFSLELSPEARSALPKAPREVGVDVPATFRWSDESWEVGLDLKGHTSFRTIDEKPSFKIDFGEYLDQSFHGVRRLTLNNLVSDPSGMSEALAYTLFAERGLPAPRHTYACVQVDGEDYGLYGLVETMDEQFLARTFEDPSGWLYDRDGDADLTPDGIFAFEVEEEGPGAAHEDLVALVEALERAPEVLPVIEARFDADALIGALAVEIALASVDGYALNANNYLLYHEPDPDRWWLLPWGVDQAFRGPAGVVETSSARPGILAERCLAEAACAARLGDALRELADPMAALDARGLAERLRGAPDPRAETTPLSRWWARERMISWVAARPAALRAYPGP
jgi:spore coat protein CotH